MIMLMCAGTSNPVIVALLDVTSLSGCTFVWAVKLKGSGVAIANTAREGHAGRLAHHGHFKIVLRAIGDAIHHS